MKFMFVGKKTLTTETLTENTVYNIIQFEHYKNHMIVYVIDDRRDLICIPYLSTGKFNEDWKNVG